MELVHEFTLTATLGLQVPIGRGPYGTRGFGGVDGGTVTGDRISGRVLPGGGDWVLFGPGGWGRPDVRLQIETTDGAFILMTYEGLIEWNDAVRTASAESGPTGYDDHYWRTAPRLETGDARYEWVNHTLFVAQGKMLGGGGAEYDVHRVT